MLEPEAVLSTRDEIKFVYTPLHGTGIRAVPALLDQFGFKYSIVQKQAVGDGRFPTVKSPNPENAEALELAIQQAEAEHADVVMATDPDADRMGVAVRDASGKMVLLTGNQIGSIMAYYRVDRLIAQGVLPAGLPQECGDHQDVCHDRPAEADRGAFRRQLHRDADRLQVHRREDARLRAGA